MKTKLVAVAALVGTMSLATAASAQTEAERETARRLMDDGDRFVEQQRFDEALDAYEKAHAIMHVPTTGIDVALTLTILGRMVEAREVALEIVSMPGAGTESNIFAEARRDAAELADRLTTKIPTLRFELPSGVDPSMVRAWIDGEELPERALAVPRRLDPGKHTIRVERLSGGTAFVREIELRESARSLVRVELPGASGPSRSDDAILGLPPLAFAGLATSAVGLTVGTITGLVSLGKADDARARCGPDTRSCDLSAESYIDASKTFGWISTASFALAVAGGAVATYALVMKTDRVGQRSIGVHASATGAFVRGTF